MKFQRPFVIRVLSGLVWVETIGFGLKFYPHQSFLGRTHINIVNNTDTLSGRLLVLVRQQTAVRTWRTVGEVSALGTVCVLRLKEQEGVAGT